MINGKTFYQILGVQPDAEDIVIKAAYRALSQRYHPDKWVGDPKVSLERMTELNKAYETLSDEAQKQKYDETLKNAGREREYPDSEPVEEIYKEAVSEQDVDWKYATEFFPDLNQHLDELKKINYGLAFAYRSILLTRKNFNDAKLLKQRLKKSFLERYFGTDKSYLKFAEKLIEQNRRLALLELNQAVRVLGDSVQPYVVIQKIKEKHQLEQIRALPDLVEKIRRLRQGGGPTLAIEILRELGYTVIEHKKGGFLGGYNYDVFHPDGTKVADCVGSWDLFALTRDKIIKIHVGED